MIVLITTVVAFRSVRIRRKEKKKVKSVQLFADSEEIKYVIKSINKSSN